MSSTAQRKGFKREMESTVRVPSADRQCIGDRAQEIFLDDVLFGEPLLHGLEARFRINPPEAALTSLKRDPVCREVIVGGKNLELRTKTFFSLKKQKGRIRGGIPGESTSLPSSGTCWARGTR
jgi:hypothetical protein